MKKFLSLLLALTMVLSLVVVPARAHDGGITGTPVVKKGETTTLTAPAAPTSVTLRGEGATSVEYPVDSSKTTYSWDSDNTAIAAFDGAVTGNTVTVKGVSKGSAKITLTMTVTYTKPDSSTDTKELPSYSANVNVIDPEGDAANAAFAGSLNIKCNGRLYSPNAAGKIVAYKHSGEQSAQWTAELKEGVTGYSNLNVRLSDNADTLTVTGTYTKDGTSMPVEAKFSVEVKDVSVTITSSITGKTAANEQVLKGGTLTLTANYVGESSNVTYKWFDKNDNEITTGAAQNVYYVPSTTVGSLGAITCKVYEANQKEPAAVSSCTVTVVDGDYQIAVKDTSITLDKINATKGIEAEFQVKKGNKYEKSDAQVTYLFSSSSSAVQVTPASSKDGKATVKLVSSIPQATVTINVSYLGKTFQASVNVFCSVLEATLAPVQSGSAATYYTSDFISAAQTALNNRSGISYLNYETVQSVTAVTQVSNSTYGYATANTIGSTNGRLEFRAGTAFGSAEYSATVTTRVSNTSTYKNYNVTFKIPVTPISTTYADQYPEPVSYGNAYRYAVQVPSGYTSYYVVAKNAPAAPTDWSSKIDNATHTSASPYYLYDNDFVNGKCVLHVVTYTSSTTYPYTANVAYCGTITVYQKNYNINYNGVAGETVQFKHADFTNFMNEIAQARGDSGKNNYNNTYVTFNDVTFSMPSSAQGTLYYNGTAMSNSNSSSAFNRSTKVTNLDNITFVPNAKTSAKSITLNFTLHATKYTSYGNTRGTAVNYPGSVVISIVREDIKYTVAPGDSISFTSSDFQNFLRTQSGINYNHNVDYVTFDQSAVNSLNEGVLYNGYSGFSAVKATDKFYYTTTNSYTQNALSDVTFRASTYAKAGTTVYVPFTIYVKLGTSNVISKQVEGTVAIKIAQTMNFADVKPADYFYNPVKWAVNKNITKGTSATTFSPYKTCTRAEIVTFLWRDAGSPMPTTSRHPFTDVSYSMGSDFYNAILWANQNGITAGTTTTTFSPNKTCTRAEIVTFLWRYAKKPVGYGSNNPFTDVNKTDHAPYYDAILWAVSKGITTGSTTTTFSPNGTCTRGEAVTFLYRFEGGK